ncbi:nuclease-related domain-containing protein [Streptomyces sp. NPDC059083]|uniref:nuclease-related domain-containing protein n=1 Tax=unclassified Streptomyces TaxID=2593676 RepID=UPI00368CD538
MNLPNGTAVAWADRATKAVTIKVRQYQDEALLLLRAHLGDGLTVDTAGSATSASPVGAPPRQVPPPPNRVTPPASLPPLTPSEDLARNPPGARLIGLMAERGPSAVQRLRSKLLRQSSEWDSFYTGLKGEKKVGRELARLSRCGWHALHGIQKGNGGDIDHLLIGPGGVFTINTKTHCGAAVWVGDAMVKVNGGPPRPYAAASKTEADFVRRSLQQYCDFEVSVEPMLVFVGVESLHQSNPQSAVRVCQEREIAALGPLTGSLTAEQVETVYAVARHRRVWLRG